jgi:hypothetical protein
VFVVLILIYIAYFTEFYQLFSIGTYGFTLIDLFTIVFFLIIFKKFLWDGDKLQFSFHYGTVFIFLFLLAVLLSSLNPIITGDKNQIVQYLKSSTHLIFLISFTLVFATYPVKTSIWVKIIQLWLLLSIFINIFAAYQITARAFDLPFAWLEMSNLSLSARGEVDKSSISQLSLQFGSFFRATSIFYEPSGLAFFNTFIISFIVAPYFKGAKPFFRSKALTLIILILSLIAMLLTFSMTGLLGIFLILISTQIFKFSKRILYAIPAVILSVIILIAADSVVEKNFGVSVFDLFGTRFRGILNQKGTEGMAGESFFTRKNTIIGTLETWQEYPVTGIGFGTLQYANKGMIFSDNGAGSLLAETGSIGFITFSGMILAFFIYSYKINKYKKYDDILSDEEKQISSVLFFIMITIFIINYVSGNNVVHVPTWYTINIVCALLNTIFIRIGFKSYSFILVKKPLKEYFRNYLNIRSNPHSELSSDSPKTDR